MPWRLLADILALLHLVFVLYVMLGGLSVLRWPRSAWVHLPAVVWGVLVEAAGWTCPLTPLENLARAAAGKAGYAEGFIDHYLRILLYPAGLSRELQLVLGGVVLLSNSLIYRLVWRRWRNGRVG
ncbi:MAG: DUF2784 domain-containing protein [Desulfuromonas sp.]|nr:MAG: DUF2784 domain-containing protein [Desulfuromonas sp.]